MLNPSSLSFVIVIVSCKNTGTQVSLVVAEFPIVLGRAPEVLFSPTLEPSLLPFLCLGQSLCHSPCSSICVVFTSRVGDVSDHRPWFTVVFRFCMTFCECVCIWASLAGPEDQQAGPEDQQAGPADERAGPACCCSCQ